MDALDRAVTARPARTLKEREWQMLVKALATVIGDGRPALNDVAQCGVVATSWADVVARLRMSQGDAAPLLRLLIRRATALQAREFLDLFVLAFSGTP